MCAPRDYKNSGTSRSFHLDISTSIHSSKQSTHSHSSSDNYIDPVGDITPAGSKIAIIILQGLDPLL